MRMGDDALEMMTVVCDNARLPEFDINELAMTQAAQADAAASVANAEAQADDLDDEMHDFM